MLRFLVVVSATTFSSYNPDIAKNRVMPQIGLADEFDERRKAGWKRRQDLSISHLKPGDEAYPCFFEDPEEASSRVHFFV